MKNFISKKSSSDRKATVQENRVYILPVNLLDKYLQQSLFCLKFYLQHMRENVFIFHYTANDTVSSFFSWIILHCIDLPHFLYPSIWSKIILEASLSCPESHTMEPGLALKTSIWLTKALKSIFIKDLLDTKEVFPYSFPLFPVVILPSQVTNIVTQLTFIILSKTNLPYALSIYLIPRFPLLDTGAAAQSSRRLILQSLAWPFFVRYWNI